MTDDLVKQLRWLGDHASFEPHMHHVAADRIEKLEAALREIIEIHPFKDPEGDASVKAVVDLMFHINLTARRALNTSQERVKNNGES
jgi:hypothetical protein